MCVCVRAAFFFGGGVPPKKRHPAWPCNVWVGLCVCCLFLPWLLLFCCLAAYAANLLACYLGSAAQPASRKLRSFQQASHWLPSRTAKATLVQLGLLWQPGSSGWSKPPFWRAPRNGTASTKIGPSPPVKNEKAKSSCSQK